MIWWLDYFAAAFGKPQAVISKEALAEKNANRTGESIELPSRGKSSSGGTSSSKIYTYVSAY